MSEGNHAYDCLSLSLDGYFSKAFMAQVSWASSAAFSLREA